MFNTVRRALPDILRMEVFMMIRHRWAVLLVALVPTLGVSGCQRETPVEKSQVSQPSSVVEHTVRQSVDAIQTPMDKARGVEGTLSEAAGRTAERVQETAQ
jgi:hypothetical protein